MEATLVNVHLWQEQGLGVAPFHVETIISFPGKHLLEAGCVEAYNNQAADACQRARAYGVHLCTCDSCGMALQNNFVIRDANKKFFVVGCDCALKTGDTVVMERAKYLEKKRVEAIKEAKIQEARERRLAEVRKQLDAQREKNGGLTDREVQEQKQLEYRNAVAVQMKEKNRWLIEVLCAVSYGSDFITSMLDTLERQEASKLSPKCLIILSDIYAKTKTNGAKRGSKKFNEAMDEFGRNTEAQ